MPKPKTRHHEHVPLPPDAFLLTFPEAQRLSRLGRSKLYRLIDAGRLKSVKIDGAHRIVRGSLEGLAR